MSYKAKYRDWLVSDYFDQETKNELQEIEDNEKEIEDRFYKDLEFGTGGMRGKIAAGTNRFNRYTVRRATQGLANYVINYNNGGPEEGVVIAYDSHYGSPEFAREAALVLNGNGIKTYLFDELRPTPELSFAVRELGASAGIVITASHNPAEYNGYKVYASDGGQVVPSVAREITAEIEEIGDYSLINMMPEEKGRDRGLFQIIGDKIDRAYIEAIKNVLPQKELAREKGEDLKIVFTPLHGAANKPVRSLLTGLGFSGLEIVEEQAEPDSDFPTVESPNPEEYSAFAMALEKAEQEEAELILGTDPDGDRLGIVVQDDTGEYIGLNGNEVGVLMADFLLNRLELPEKGVIIKTIVTTEMIHRLAEDFDVQVMDVLTGFKFIGEKILEFEDREEEFIMGFEESYGYLVGTYARDKDAVSAAGLLAIMALYYKENGSSLYRRLNELWEKYGYYREDLESIRREGKDGQDQIERTLKSLREDSPEEIAGKAVTVLSDYLKGKRVKIKEEEESEIALPSSNVLQYRFEDDSVITVRPSGTEPKIKIYFAVNGDSEAEAEAKMERLKNDFMQQVEELLG
ncbi:MAG: phospho-sugar mutase [Halanaerobiaceae bacterium]